MKRFTLARATDADAGSRVFMTARWTDVVMVNFLVPPNLLQPHVPPGSVLDTPDGQPDLHLLSIVALRFRDTRVRGVKIPTAQDFAELNLRFYVRQGDKRAAVFLREFVPTPLIVIGARLFYQQPYFLARITHRVTKGDGSISVRTRFRNRQHRGGIDLIARNEPTVPPEDSVEHFLKEHYWGFHRGRGGGGISYRVEHPVWITYPVEQAEVTVDPGVLLGKRWRSVDWDDARHSVVFAEGSNATVYDAMPLAGDADASSMSDSEGTEPPSRKEPS